MPASDRVRVNGSPMAVAKASAVRSGRYRCGCQRISQITTAAVTNENTQANNLVYATHYKTNADQGDFKVDWRPNQKDYMTFRFSAGAISVLKRSSP